MKSRRTSINPVISFTPLVDVMFNLLIFILLTATFVNQPPIIPVHLPEAGTAEPQPEQEMVIVITAQAEDNIYVNGKLMKTVEKYFTGYPVSADLLIVGMEPWEQPKYRFHGFIDEVLIFNRVLSEAEMQVLYETGKP